MHASGPVSDQGVHHALDSNFIPQHIKYMYVVGI